MSPFRFRLTTFQRLKEAARDACREQFVDALRVDDRLRQQIAEFQAMIREARDLQTVPAGQVDVDRILSAQRHEMVATAEMRHVEHQRLKVLEEIERRRAALVEADREVKTLEKLKTSQQAEHRRRAEVVEMKLMDETAGRRRPEEVDA